MADVLTVADLELAKKHDTFHGEVITGKAGAVASGADIDTATNAVTGQVQTTLPKVLRDVGFKPASFNFVTGGTLGVADTDKCIYNPAPAGDNNWYSWSGVLPHAVAPGSDPTADGSGYVPRTDVVLRYELASTSGISLIATNRFAVYVHSAPDDGVTDATSYFADAAALSASNGYVQVIVKPPLVKYLLSSSPVIPDNVDIIASPDWFTGTGELPIHTFMSESEGVDPRIYRAKDWHHSVAPINNGERYWTGQHTVDIKYDQLYSGADSVKQDCVGHGTRAYVRGKNGRGWGGVDLVALFPTAVGAGATDTSAYGREIDVNNNSIDINDFEVLGGPRCKGLVIASGGEKRPEEAIYITATSYSNRWLAAMRWSANCEFGIVPDEGYLGPVINIPVSSKGIVGSDDLAEKCRIAVSSDRSGWDLTGNSGALSLHVDEEKTVIYGALATITRTMSASLDATKTNCLYINANITTNTILNGTLGQELTIIVGQGVTLTLNPGGNIYLASGAPIGLAGRAAIRFRKEGAFWWQISPAVGGLA